MDGKPSPSGLLTIGSIHSHHRSTALCLAGGALAGIKKTAYGNWKVLGMGGLLCCCITTWLRPERLAV